MPEAVRSMIMKLAVLFPGIGYHTDKPLLYYAKKLAAANGFQVKDVPYGGFASGIKGDPDKMRLAFESALRQSEEILRDVDFAACDTILFISKSIGTAVAAAYAKQRQLKTCNIFYTPVEQTFLLLDQPGLLFHGTSDPWMPHDLFMELCAKTGYPYRLIEGGNHSLETGDVLTDLRNLQSVMEETDRYIRRCAVKKYRFYGWRTADVPAAAEEYQSIRNPRQLYDLLSELWCAETCAPRMRAGWTEENRTFGQCSITAFLAQDIFGGDVYGILRPDGNYHCYNVVGNCVFDLTSEQFGDETLSYENNPKQSREVHFAKEEKRLRYEYLKEALRAKLCGR